MRYFVTAIGTDSGKTLVSAILCEALQADYWKPVQAGFPRDADTVKSLLSNQVSKIHNETYLLNTPASPHASAKLDNVVIDLKNFIVPEAKRDLVIEGAGGCLVPLNDNDFVIDLARQIDCQVILVSNLYLGSINHTLLTADYLKRNKFNVKGIVFNGQRNPASEEIILKHMGFRPLLRVDQETEVTKETVKKYAELLNENWL
ncbi:ATP-dependent dethiobiotin synthetase BioD [Cytophagales bacterium WSM2-2]|nr:ATP-dependent dethiobiotin synthetase BioD [Cytophagales bacterium WSM2-2]